MSSLSIPILCWTSKDDIQFSSQHKEQLFKRSGSEDGETDKMETKAEQKQWGQIDGIQAVFHLETARPTLQHPGVERRGEGVDRNAVWKRI